MRGDGVPRIIARMKLMCLRAVLLLAAMPMPLVGVERTTSQDVGEPGAVPIPLSTGWVEFFLLMIVWLFVAAAIIGPLVTYFRVERRSSEVFIDDRKSH